MSENTKALEIALDIRNKCVVFGDPHFGTRFLEISAKEIIQQAINEATTDLRTQLAEANQKISASNVFVAAAYEDEIEQLKAQLAEAKEQLAAFRTTVASISGLIPRHDYLCHGTSEAAMRGFLMLIDKKCGDILNATRQPNKESE